MPKTYVLLLLTITITCFIAHPNAARELPNGLTPKLTTISLDEATANGTLGECWNAMAEIKSCGNEIAGYFTNGTVDIGASCCRAIKMISLHCWPAMLTAIGFTPDQFNVVVGYCDASVAPAASPLSNTYN